MSNDIIIQKLKRSFTKKIRKAMIYYDLINSLNNLGLTRKQVELLAFTNVRGTISSLSAKNEFIKQFGSSIDSINNMISKMYSKKLLIKKDSKIKVNPVLNLDFSKPIVLNITLDDVTESNDKEDSNKDIST